MHHRNLTAFLSMARPPANSHRRTDVVADHYFETGWSNRTKHKRLFDAQSADRNTKAKHSVDVHLAHISSERVDKRRSDKAFSWDHVDLALIVDAFVEFTSDLASARAEPRSLVWRFKGFVLSDAGTAATGNPRRRSHEHEQAHRRLRWAARSCHRQRQHPRERAI